MAFRFKKHESISEGLRRIATEQIDKAIKEIDDPQLSQSITVHQARKRCKKLRGLIRIVAPVFDKWYRRENSWLRDTAKVLSTLRDAKTSLQAFDTLIEHPSAAGRMFRSIGQQLEQDAEAVTANEQATESQLLQVRERLDALRQRVGKWSLSTEGFSALQPGVKNSYAKARKSMRQAMDDPSTEALHAWRKHVKYHGYQCRLLESVWPAMVAARSREAGQLGDWLGEDHDLAVMGQQIQQAAKRYGDREETTALDRLVVVRRRKLQGKCYASGARLFAENKQAFVRRYGRYWEIWQS